MENGLAKMEDAWARVSFQFTRHKISDVHIAKMAEEDFEVRASALPRCWLVAAGSVASRAARAGGASCTDHASPFAAAQMLEDNQVLVQGMMANRYMATFRDAVLGWNSKLMSVADVVVLLGEIQRTWAYLESLFIASEEVKKELPEATKRFASVDVHVKSVLSEFQRTQNCVACCERDGLLSFLERQQAELEARHH